MKQKFYVNLAHEVSGLLRSVRETLEFIIYDQKWDAALENNFAKHSYESTDSLTVSLIHFVKNKLFGWGRRYTKLCSLELVIWSTREVGVS